eukprot:4008960-Amphidinium_carterae.1
MSTSTAVRPCLKVFLTYIDNLDCGAVLISNQVPSSGQPDAHTASLLRLSSCGALALSYV